MATSRTTFTIEDELVQTARTLGINVSAAARDGVAAAVRAALVASDRAAYKRYPETSDEGWGDSEAWGLP